VYRVDHHFLAVLKSSDAANDMVDLLPETDIAEELKTLLRMQLDVCVHMLEAKHYGTNNLNSFCDLIDDIKEEAARLSEEAEWRNE